MRRVSVLVMAGLMMISAPLGCLTHNAGAVEPAGTVFTGTVMENGGNAPAGLWVKAEVDGVKYGGDMTTLDLILGTVYYMLTEGDDSNTPEKDGANTGELVVFWVGEYVCHETSTDWQPEGLFGMPYLSNLNLNYDTMKQPALLKINELMVGPASGPEWIELYNPESYPVDLANYRLQDDDGFTMPLSGTLPAAGFYVAELPSPQLDDGSQDEMMLAWNDPADYSGGTEWVVIDRVEYGPLGSGPDDTRPTNEAIMDNALTPPLNTTLERAPDDGTDTDQPVVDFFISSLPPSTKGYTNTQVQPSITLLTPQGPGETADGSYNIGWLDSDPDDNATITLYYDPDMAPNLDGDEVLIATVPQGEDSPADNYYWDTTGVQVGTCFLLAEIKDPLNPPTYSYAQYVLSIIHPPSIHLVEPDGAGDTADQSFVVQWTDHDSDDNATIVLYYDMDTDPSSTILIGTVPQGEDGADDTFLWDTAGIPEGDYYVRAVISDGYYPPQENYSMGPVSITHPPSIVITEPDGTDDEADLSYTIQWDDWDADHDAVINLYYDTDGSGYDGIPIINGLGEDDPVDQYAWAVSGFPEGVQLYVYASITGGSTTNHCYGSGPVTVVHRPSISLVEPDGTADDATTSFTVEWTDWDTDDDASIALYYDYDTIAGNEMHIADLPNVEDDDSPAGDSYVWDTSLVPEGSYYIKAVITDGKNTSFDYSTGMVRIAHDDPPSISLANPSVDVALALGATEPFRITWLDMDPDSNATIALYYDTDELPGGEVLISIVPQGEDSPDNTFKWDISALPAGSYYIKAVINDSLSDQTSVSPGRLLISEEAPPPPGGGGTGDGTSPLSDWWWIILLLALITIFLVIFLILYKRRKDREREEEKRKRDDGAAATDREGPDPPRKEAPGMAEPSVRAERRSEDAGGDFKRLE